MYIFRIDYNMRGSWRQGNQRKKYKIIKYSLRKVHFKFCMRIAFTIAVFSPIIIAWQMYLACYAVALL